MTNRNAGGEIRFGVKSEEGLRSGVIRVWANRNRSDVYVAARSVASEYKVSLHESGNWQIGFTREHALGHSPRTRTRVPIREVRERLITRWSRPPEVMPGLTRAFAVLVSAAGVVLRGDDGSGDDDIYWYPKPKEKPIAKFDIFLSTPGARVTGWPGRRSLGASYVGSFPLRNGERVWVVAYESETVPPLTDGGIPWPPPLPFGRSAKRPRRSRGLPLEQQQEVHHRPRSPPRATGATNRGRPLGAVDGILDR